MSGKDSLNTLSTLDVNGNSYEYYSLPKAAKELGNIDKLPASMKVLLENLLRNEDGETVTREDLSAMADWLKERKIDREIQYRPARVLMQDFTGVPGIVDLAAMRDAVSNAGQNPEQINPLSPVDLVIDHSVMVDKYASPEAFKENVRIEMERNKERYEFLRWGRKRLKTSALYRQALVFVTKSTLSILVRVSGPKKKTEKPSRTQIRWSVRIHTPP